MPVLMLLGTAILVGLASAGLVMVIHTGSVFTPLIAWAGNMKTYFQRLVACHRCFSYMTCAVFTGLYFAFNAATFGVLAWVFVWAASSAISSLLVAFDPLINEQS